jgi:hypothetical protein
MKPAILEVVKRLMAIEKHMAAQPDRDHTESKLELLRGFSEIASYSNAPSEHLHGQPLLVQLQAYQAMGERIYRAAQFRSTPIRSIRF